MPTFATPEPITVTRDLVLADGRLRAGERADTVVVIGRATRPIPRTSSSRSAPAPSSPTAA
jgi:hypothetical protein